MPVARSAPEGLQLPDARPLRMARRAMDSTTEQRQAWARDIARMDPTMGQRRLYELVRKQFGAGLNMRWLQQLVEAECPKRRPYVRREAPPARRLSIVRPAAPVSLSVVAQLAASLGALAATLQGLNGGRHERGC